MARIARLLHGMLGWALALLKWLAIPIGLLLFLQWPLRDFVKAYSRDANDLRLVHLLEAPNAQSRAPTGPALSTDEVDKKLREMLPPPLPFEAPK